MPTQSIPTIRIYRSRLLTGATGSDPTPGDYGVFEDITGSAEVDTVGVSPLLVQKRQFPDLDLFTFRTRPSNYVGELTPEGTAENPLIFADDLVTVEVTVDDLPTVIFYGFVRQAGVQVYMSDEQSGRFVDTQDCAAYNVALRLARDRKSQIYGQHHIDPNDSTAALRIWGGPEPDLGRCIFNPDGRKNRDTVNTLAAAWGAIPLFTTPGLPGGTGAGFWTYGDVLRYLLHFYNDETWVENPAYADFASSNISIMGDRAPDGFTVEGSSLFEALTNLGETAGLDMHIDVTDEALNPLATLAVWDRNAGRADKWLTLQDHWAGLTSEALNPLVGEANNTDVGSNVKAATYYPDFDQVESAPTGLAGNERHAVTLTLYPHWDNADNWATNITEATLIERYTRTGSAFNTNDYRNVGRRWSANLDGSIVSGFTGSAINSAGTDLSGEFGYTNIKRLRKLGPVATSIAEVFEPALRKPVVEWRVSPSGTWDRLAGVPITFDPERDEIYIGAPDLRLIKHRTGDKTLFQALDAAIHRGGTIEFRITTEIVGDRRLRSQPTPATDTDSAFVTGRIYDFANRYQKRAISSNISAAAVQMTGFDDSTDFDTYLNALQELARPGSGSGQVSLLPFDDWYRIGDRVLGIRGGRSISFEHGATGYYPSVIAVIFDLVTGAQVQLGLGDPRRLPIR